MPRVLIVNLAKRFGGTAVRVLNLAKSLHGHFPYAVATLVGSPLHRRLEAANLVSLPVPFSRGDPRILGEPIRRAHRLGHFGSLRINSRPLGPDAAGQSFRGKCVDRSDSAIAAPQRSLEFTCRTGDGIDSAHAGNQNAA